MRKFSTLKRGPTGHARMATALAAIGALVMSGGLVMLGASTATATAGGQPGNNGTVKIGDSGDIDQVPANDPHVPCTFSIQWFNFDSGWGTLHSEVSFVPQAPTDANAIQGVSGDMTPSFTGNGGSPGAGDGMDHIEWYTLSFKGAPQEQGYHVKVTVTTPHSKGNETKSKVFWVGPCSSVDTVVTPSVVWDEPDCFDASAGWTGKVNGVNDVAGTGDGVTFAVTSGTVGPSQAVTVTATAASGYAFDAQGLKTIAFQHTFGAVPTAEQCGILGVEEIAPEVTFTDPDCENLKGADWSGTLTEIVKYKVTGTPEVGETVTVTATIKPALADQYAFPDGFDNTFDHTYPTLMELDCVLGEETVVPSPKPEKNPPVVLGTEAAVPTQVHAGMATLPATGSPTNPLLAQLMVAGGLLLLVTGGWVGLGSRANGKHHI